MKVLGITGWSGCGKTTLISALIPELRSRGWSVSALKHAHHDVDLDTPGKDTWRYREAGAQQVMLASAQRWALLHELGSASEPELEQLLAYLQPVDLVLVEGWKRSTYPKLEVWRPMQPEQAPRFPSDSSIIAVASTVTLHPALSGHPPLPLLPLNDIQRIADFVVAWGGVTS